MLHSMTGFARQSADFATGVLIWELRAVNHRFLDVQLRLPEELRLAEAEFRKQIGGCVHRGKVDCTLHYRRAAGAATDLNVNVALVRLIAARIREISALLPGARSIDPMDVLRWPDVVQQPEVDVEPLFRAAKSLLDSALEQFVAMRSSEGERIAAMIESRCDEVQALATRVRSRLPEVLEASRAKQRERLARLDVQADPGRLELELGLIAQKLDVDEELDRLQSHVAEIRTIMARDEPVGRRLDFLMQELNREANTLGSKSGDAETSRIAVDLKVLIEQMREQVQNVE